MSEKLFLTIIALATVRSIAGQQSFIAIEMWNQCDGKDAANYTMLALFTSDAQCTDDSVRTTQDILIASDSSGQKSVNSVVVLASSRYPAGAYVQIEKLYLVLSGTLEGKYVYKKSIRMVEPYLKKCSSVLGYSYISSKSLMLLISDKLDMNVLIAPNGGYDTFKKGCTTTCSGQSYIV